VRACEELLAVARSADEGVVTVRRDGDEAYVVALGTEPSVTLPAHVTAALEAAGSAPRVRDDGEVELRVAIGNSVPTTVV